MLQQYAEPVDVVTVGFVGRAKMSVVGCCVSGVVHVLNVEVAGLVTAETRYSKFGVVAVGAAPAGSGVCASVTAPVPLPATVPSVVQVPAPAGLT